MDDLGNLSRTVTKDWVWEMRMEGGKEVGLVMYAFRASRKGL